VKIITRISKNSAQIFDAILMRKFNMGGGAQHFASLLQKNHKQLRNEMSTNTHYAIRNVTASSYVQ